MRIEDKIRIRENYLKNDWIIQKRINRFNRIVGFSFIGLGLVTCFIPLTTFPLISGGLILSGVTITQLKQIINLFKYKIRNKVLFRTLKIKLLLLKNKNKKGVF